jgi:DNA adenine methylase
MTTTIKPILKYPGAKWSMAEWIISHFPAHAHYVEPYFGSGAVFFNKPPAKHEVINDLSGDVVNLFRVIREDGERLAALIEMTPWAREEYELSYEPSTEPIERARRFIVNSWQAHATGSVGGKTGWKVNGVVKDASQETVMRWVQIPNRVGPIVSRLRCYRYAPSAPICPRNDRRRSPCPA